MVETFHYNLTRKILALIIFIVVSKFSFSQQKVNMFQGTKYATYKSFILSLDSSQKRRFAGVDEYKFRILKDLAQVEYHLGNCLSCGDCFNCYSAHYYSKKDNGDHLVDSTDYSEALKQFNLPEYETLIDDDLLQYEIGYCEYNLHLYDKAIVNFTNSISCNSLDIIYLHIRNIFICRPHIRSFF